MKTLNTIILLPLILMIGACDETKKVVDVAGNIHLTGEYTITEITETQIEPNTLTLSLSALDKTVRGHAGCNTFFGNYILDLYALSFKEFAITERYCDEPVMTVERTYLNALHQTGSYSLQDNILTLLSKVDRSVLLKAKKTRKEDN
jgi:heat shock protein HslJ